MSTSKIFRAVRDGATTATGHLRAAPLSALVRQIEAEAIAAGLDGNAAFRDAHDDIRRAAKEYGRKLPSGWH